MLAARDEPSDIPANALIAGTALAAWGLAFALVVTGWARRVHHQPLVESNGSTLPALLLFLLVWQVMTAAMMLPSSLPLMRLFNRASRGQAHPRLARLAFVAAYFAVWTGFAALALAGDALLHDLARRWLWLAQRPWLIGGLALLLAGGFQFSPLKDRCLQQCRSPFGFLRRHYRRGVGAAWDMGVRHGLFCLGC
ncbi:MAG TPA: DUF2182 domain-containing protein, partial [Thermomicrobiales bacterium]|nr:DUF2182 domain-containing protein [Thermomicrobiales bacterium]